MSAPITESSSLIPQESKALRILHVLVSSPPQSFIFSRAQRDLGVQSDCVVVNRERSSNYPHDFFISFEGKSKPQRFKDMAEFLKQVIDNYDVFHFYAKPMFDEKELGFPTAMDMLLLRAAGKTIIFHFRGSEVRFPSEFQAKNPYNYVEENPNNFFTKFPESCQRRLKDTVSAMAHTMLVPDPELNTYVPEADIVPRALLLSDWPYIGGVNKTEPLVVHAPTSQIIKGTQHIIQAIQTLQEEGLSFRFKLIENMDNAEAKKCYEEADIVIDQIRIGWYGVLAVECMALGKPVICYIRPDLINTFEGDLPIANANPETVTNVLRELIQDAKKRETLGKRAREYCEAVHDATVVAKQLIDIYEQASQSNKPIDIALVLDLLTYQYEHNIVESKRLMNEKIMEIRAEKLRKYIRPKFLIPILKKLFSE